ncbi:MAG: hypothetical protein H6898_06420 [Rhodobacter sp.]|nr:hypothetical protein [Paracoccaceae bacterium]MCC0076209.1 hypothetical protein [Rhodobacter sp.]
MAASLAAGLGISPALAQSPVIVQVAAGTGHSCALGDTGQVWCWGSNEFGQIGDGTNERRTRPVLVPDLPDVASIGAGREHTCALTNDGRVFCWGSNEFGQLGNSSVLDSSRPVEVSLSRVVRQLSVGGSHNCVTDTLNRAFCWGRNHLYQLGVGDTFSRARPTPVSGLRRAFAIFAGREEHTCALTLNQALRCWGGNRYGEVGTGTTQIVRTPQAISGVRNPLSIAPGLYHSCAVTNLGRVRCWGHNGSGQLGIGGTGVRYTPTNVAGPLRAVSVSSGGYHSCAITPERTVWCWGMNFFGQIGDGGASDRLRPVALPSLADVVSVSAGQLHTCAATAAGRAFCWGSNRDGQIGDGSTVGPWEGRRLPVEVQFPISAAQPLFPIQGYGNAPLERLNFCFGAHGPDGSNSNRLRYFSGQYHAGVDLRTRDIETPEIVSPVDGEIVYYSRIGNRRNSVAPDWMNTVLIIRGDDSRHYVLGHVDCTGTDAGQPLCDIPAANEIRDWDAYPVSSRRRVSRGQTIGTTQNWDAEHLHLGVSTAPLVSDSGVLLPAFTCADWGRTPYDGATACLDNNITLTRARDLTLSRGFFDPLTLWADTTTCECLYATDGSFCAQE